MRANQNPHAEPSVATHLETETPTVSIKRRNHVTRVTSHIYCWKLHRKNSYSPSLDSTLTKHPDMRKLRLFRCE